MRVVAEERIAPAKCEASLAGSDRRRREFMVRVVWIVAFSEMPGISVAEGLRSLEPSGGQIGEGAQRCS